MTPTERAARAHALAEAADDPKDKAAFRAAAYAWDRISRPGVTFSLDPLRTDLRTLKRDIANAAGPFQAPRPEESEDSAPEPPENAPSVFHKAGIAF